MTDRGTPLKLVRLWPKLVRGCYEELDILAGAKADETVWWPDYCRLPVNAAVTYLQKTGMERKQASVMASELTACWLWRHSRVVYRFDPTLAEVLAGQGMESDDADVLPAQLLLHPPHPAVYIKTPDLLEGVDGFFYWVDYDIVRKEAALRVQWVCRGMERSFGQAMHISPGATLRECVWDTIKASRENLGEPAVVELRPVSEMAGPLLSALQLALYLAAENAEIAEEREAGEQVRIYQVGAGIGAAIRGAWLAQPGQDGVRRRPHARRGHWHHYWTGPKGGERSMILKWTAPTFIHTGDGGNVVRFPART